MTRDVECEGWQRLGGKRAYLFSTLGTIACIERSTSAGLASGERGPPAPIAGGGVIARPAAGAAAAGIAAAFCASTS